MQNRRLRISSRPLGVETGEYPHAHEKYRDLDLFRNMAVRWPKIRSGSKAGFKEMSAFGRLPSEFLPVVAVMVSK
jgi:hypothetical protein